MIAESVQLAKRKREDATVNIPGRSAITSQTDVHKNILHLVSRAGLKTFAVLCVGAYLMAIGVEILLSWLTCLLPSRTRCKTGSLQIRSAATRSQTRRKE